MTIQKWYLGTRKKSTEQVYLGDFRWECDWYWAGGHITTRDMFCHFKGCFLDIVDQRGHSLGKFKAPWDQTRTGEIISNGCSIWEPLEFFLDDAQYTQKEWWRIKDLFKQFYILRETAEVFHYGGHCCSSSERNPLETNKEMVKKINQHIELVIIPEIRKCLNKE